MLPQMLSMLLRTQMIKVTVHLTWTKAYFHQWITPERYEEASRIYRFINQYQGFLGVCKFFFFFLDCGIGAFSRNGGKKRDKDNQPFLWRNRNERVNFNFRNVLVKLFFIKHLQTKSSLKI